MCWDWKSLQALILRAPLCGAYNTTPKIQDNDREHRKQGQQHNKTKTRVHYFAEYKNDSLVHQHSKYIFLGIQF